MYTESLRETAGKLLVVDDEPAVRDVLCRWLTHSGFTCAQAGSVDEALALLGDREFELVTTDICMPGRSGIELLTQITRLAPDTAVLMLTAVGDTGTAIDAMTRGACGYLIKPVDQPSLCRAVRQGLERRRRMLETRRETRRLQDQVTAQHFEVRRAHEETLRRLFEASRVRDEETGAHVRRTGLYCGLLATALHWTPERVEAIRLAAPMHDIGKIGIPDAILRKPGSLTPQERAIMQSHTICGAQMLDGSQWPVLRLASQIALWHHERWDGAGYPDRLAGSAIPAAARILAIADVYDALTHDRVYRPALSEEAAGELMRKGCGTHFDPEFFEAFCSVLPEIRRIAEEQPDDEPPRPDERYLFGSPQTELVGAATMLDWK